MIANNKAEFEKMNVLKWREAGYTGKGYIGVVLDTPHKPYPHTKVNDPFNDNNSMYGHKGQVAQVIREVAPDADITVFSWTKAGKQEIIDWIKAHESEIDVINVSLAINTSIDLFKQLEQFNIPVIVATGNGSKAKIQSVASYPWTIAVGAWEEHRDKKATYSNYGTNLDGVAYTNIYIDAGGSNDLLFNGTSCSAPVTSSLIKIYNQWRKENGLPKMTRNEAREFLHKYALDKDVKGYDVISGYGLFVLPNDIPQIDAPKPPTPPPEEPPVIEEHPVEEDRIMLVAISDGHGMETAGKRTPLLPNGMVMRENEFNRAVKRYLDVELKRCGLRTLFVASGDTDVPLIERTNLANLMQASIYVSIHANAFDGVFNATDPKGVETYHYPGSVEGKKLAEAIHKQLIKGVSQTNRGVKSSNFHELRETTMPAVLVEAGFMDNLEEAMLLLDDSFRREVAREIAMGVCDYLNVPYIPEVRGMKIASSPTATIAQMKAWAITKGANPLLIDLAETFYTVSVAAGINPIVTYCQSAKETGYMKFGGVLDASFKNPCGLKTTAGGSDTSVSAHQKFTTWEQGIQAQVDHLALYTGVAGYPKVGTPDPRHFPYLFGTAPTVESLGGKWAPSTDYGTSIVRMVKEVEGTVAQAPIPEPPIKLVDISLIVHGQQVVVQGVFKDNINYIPVKFLESLGYIIEGTGNVVKVEYNKGGLK